MPTYAGEAAVHKKLTITVDEEVYRGLYRVIGRQRISHFIEELVRPYVVAPERQRRSAAIDALLTLRRKQAPVSDADIARVRQEGRP